MHVLRLQWQQEPEDGSPIMLGQLLNAMNGPSTIKAGAHPGCPDCGCEVDLQQYFAWVVAPRVVIVKLGRTRMGPRGIYRDDALVDGPRLGLETCGAFYDLAAQVLRSGPATAGHCVARVLRRGLWWTCDDASVRSCPRRRVEVPGGDCCVLVCLRR